MKKDKPTDDSQDAIKKALNDSNQKVTLANKIGFDVKVEKDGVKINPRPVKNH